MVWCMCALVLLLALGGTSQAAITFVHPTTGNDTNACGLGIGAPKRTLGGTAGCADQCLTTPGDVCELRGGSTAAAPLVYVESLDSTQRTLASGAPGTPMIVRVRSGEYAMIQPTGGCFILRFAGPAYWTFDGNGPETPPARNHLVLDGRFMGCGVGATMAIDVGSITYNAHLTFQHMTSQHAANSGGNGCSYSGAQGRVNDITFTNMEFNGTHGTYPDYQGGYHFYGGQHGGSRWTIQDSLIHHAGGMGIQFNNSHQVGVATGHIIRRNRIYENGKRTSTTRCSGSDRGGIAMTTYQATAQIYSNWIYNNGAAGLTIYGALPGGNHQVYNNTFYNNGSHGIAAAVFSDSVNLLIKNNILSNNAGAGIRVGSQYFTTPVGHVYDTNDFYQNGGGTVVLQAGASATVTNTLTSNPQFVNPTAGNFYLHSTSPLTGVGLDLASVGVTSDIDNHVRTVPFSLGGAESGQVTPNVLVFTQPPTNAVVDAPLVPAVQVCAQVNGITQTSFAASIALVHTVGTGTLTGGTGGAPTSGCRTFSGLSFNLAGAKTIRADATGAESSTANVTITAAPVVTLSPFTLMRGAFVRMR